MQNWFIVHWSNFKSWLRLPCVNIDYTLWIQLERQIYNAKINDFTCWRYILGFVPWGGELLNNSNSSASSTFKSTITVQRSILQSNKLYSIFGGTKTVEDWSNDCNKAVNNWSVAGLHHEHLVKWAWDDQKSDNQKIHTRYPAEEICCDIRYCAGISAPHSWSSDHESNHLQSVSFWSKLSPRL